ncbi:hypothetical protein AA19596_1621 [Acetobacter fabarum DSM 19596]|nr:hypothetical protein AA19596_1621 [Acetobacter fabarum DSM 19596]
MPDMHKATSKLSNDRPKFREHIDSQNNRPPPQDDNSQPEKGGGFRQFNRIGCAGYRGGKHISRSRCRCSR